MRLEPVYVVAPRVASPSMPTRRAFLIASGTFAIGASLGGACGYAVGAHTAPDSAAAPNDAQPAVEPTVEPKPDEPLKPSGDVELDELRHLAVKAPIEELYAQQQVFLHVSSMRYRNDQILWRGVERLCDVTLTRENLENRRQNAKALAQVIELGEPGLKKLIGERVQRLRKVK